MRKTNNKEKIIQKSINLFSKHGYDRVTIRQIAKEVGIKESSIYNHFKSKETILDTILNQYITEMTTNEIPLEQASQNLDVSFQYFYKTGLKLYINKLKKPQMMKITRIILIESYHNTKIKTFLKKEMLDNVIKGWTALFELMKIKKLIQENTDTKQLAESFYYYGLFLFIEHFIINYPEDNETFLKNLETKTEKHITLIYNSIKK